MLDRLGRLNRNETENPYLFESHYASAPGGTSGKRGMYLWNWDTFVTTANITYRMEVAADQHGAAASAEAPGPSGRTTVDLCRLLIIVSAYQQIALPSDAGSKSGGAHDSRRHSTARDDAAAGVFQPDHLVGYVSIVEELAAMMLNGALQPLPHWIASNSEPCCRR